MEALKCQNLNKSYDGKKTYVIKDLNLTIEKGEIFGLLGPNGAGKTTLISMMCGLMKPTSGKISLNNLNFQSNPTEIQKKMGVVPQEYALYPTLTAFENLEFFGSLYNLKGKDLKNRIESGLKKVNLMDYRNRPIKDFSGGMKRRINLLTGILHNPEILFLDEPTVGVDIQSREVILSILEELNTGGTTIIYTSHHLSEAQNFCTQISIIDKGRILAQGTAEELINSVQPATNLEEVFLELTGNQIRNDA
ncbi:ABC transporter ATP-binding protein [Moheibacter lacus]|uniref:ABC transporter ATP-binding protein n=1 Tax=Moheibacter lacus TaxID=2745851 RepID=A0A838ZK70_9FLAO|nr:ABC transporter ATP-binding protein [Moheibacter lacus]MBA5628774.1 ABC transporter ATP-binding protein [Moheibacter lacus]